MRSVIAFLLCVAVAQLSVESFSPILATRAIPATKGKGKTKAAAKPAKKVAAKKVAAKKVSVKKTVVKTKGKAPAKTKAKAVDAKAERAAKIKAKATTAAKAKAATNAKNKAKAEAVAKAKAKAFAEKQANRPKPQAKKVKVVATTSATAARVANSGTDAALAITKGVKNKNNNGKKSLFPGLQATAKRPESAFKKGKEKAKANAGVAKKAARAPVEELKNPLEFGLQVAQSEKGQEAIGILIDGGLKFVDAILSEGKKTKVVIPRGYDSGTGELKKPKITNIGYKQLLDAGIFAGTEFFEVAKTNYEKFYVGGEAKKNTFIIPAKVDPKTGKVLKKASENYVVNIGGERVTMKRPLR